MKDRNDKCWDLGRIILFSRDHFYGYGDDWGITLLKKWNNNAYDVLAVQWGHPRTWSLFGIYLGPGEWDARLFGVLSVGHDESGWWASLFKWYWPALDPDPEEDPAEAA